VSDLLARLREAVPHTWLDPLLSGPDAVIHHAPTPEVEALVNAIRKRMETAVAEWEREPAARVSRYRVEVGGWVYEKTEHGWFGGVKGGTAQMPVSVRAEALIEALLAAPSVERARIRKALMDRFAETPFDRRIGNDTTTMEYVREVIDAIRGEEGTGGSGVDGATRTVGAHGRIGEAPH